MKKRPAHKPEDSISPLEDYVFAYLFGDQRNITILAGFLKTILRLPEDEYDSFTIVNPILKRIRKEEKEGIVDVRVHTRSGRTIHVELQREKKDFMDARILFYICSLINGQIKRGQKWDTIHAVVSIIISEHALTDEEEYLNYYELNNVKSGKVFTDLLNLVIINLDKVPGEDDGRAVWPWLKFMKSRGGENLEHLGRRNEELDMAISMLNVLKLPGYLHEMAEYREIRRRDEAARESYLIRTSREKGLEEGRKKTREETVRKMKLKGYPPDEIADITGFSPDHIARL